jgi:hypothetical protein
MVVHHLVQFHLSAFVRHRKNRRENWTRLTLLYLTTLLYDLTIPFFGIGRKLIHNVLEYHFRQGEVMVTVCFGWIRDLVSQIGGIEAIHIKLCDSMVINAIF